MTYQELATQVRQLPVHERLDLITLLTLSLKDELTPPVEPGTDWDTLATELIDRFGAATTPVLSEGATTRAGIYEEHP